jgi:hypothetical protein
MKSILPITLFLFCSFFVSGNDTLQYYIKSKPISQINEPYIEATLCRKPFSNKFFIEIDYGQEIPLFNVRDKRVSDKYGDSVEFPSRVAALNYLVTLGYYIFDHQYTFDSSGDITTQTLLLQHKNNENPVFRRFE